jgi:hypothetical protein
VPLRDLVICSWFQSPNATLMALMVHLYCSGKFFLLVNFKPWPLHLCYPCYEAHITHR